MGYKESNTRQISVFNMSSMSTLLSDAVTDYEYDVLDNIDRFYAAFKEFVGNATVGEVLAVATIDYHLPIGNEFVCETIHLWTAPVTISHPLQECYDTKIVPVVMDFMDRLDDSELVCLSFRWKAST